MKILLIYNSFSGHGRSRRILPEVQKTFLQKNIDLDVKLTKYPQNATEIAQEIDFSQYDGIVAGGGDGTMFEVINGYFRNKSARRIPLGVLPVGTGNAYARDLDLDNTKWIEAIDIIAQNKPRKVDVGLFKTEKNEYYFINILGLGFVSDVTKTALSLKIFGNVSYLLGVLYETIFLKTHKLNIEIDGKALERDNIFVEISNTRYTSNFLMAPSAELDDGFLDVTLLGKLSRFKLLRALPKVFTGEHIFIDEVETFKAKKLVIKTDVPKVLTPDGEVLEQTPIEVQCLHHAIEIFGR